MNRDRFWDIIKGIAILMVVLGHSLEYGGGLEYRDSGEYFNNPLFLLIYSFHMPLFMIVSGYLYYLTSTRKNWLSIFRNKVHTLLVPVLLFAVFNTILAFRPPLVVKDFVLDYVYRLPRTLWFLWDLMIFTVIKVAQRLLKLDFVIIDLIIACAMCFLPNQPLGAFVAYMYPFFCFGYYVNKKSFMSLFEKWIGTFLIVSTVSYMFLISFFKSDYLVYKSGTCFLGCDSFLMQCGYDLFRILIGFVGSLVVASIVKFVQLSVRKDTIVGDSLAGIGVLSMGIYCFQDISLCIYHHFTRMVARPDVLCWIFAFCVILAMCIAMTLITRRIGLLNKLLLGGR